jgi:hypothetical protein
MFERETGPTLMQRLASIYPEGRLREHFKCTLNVTDERAVAVQVALAEAGFRPWMDHSRPCEAREYWVDLLREYEPSDVEGLPYLELQPVFVDAEVERQESDGLMDVSRIGSKVDLDFARVDRNRYLVLDRTKQLLAASGLLGPAFRQTVDRKSRRRGPLWELCSTIPMPPLSEKMDLRTFQSLPAPRDGSVKHYVPKEGLYQPPELRYDSVAMAAMQPFDLAYTRESLGGEPRWESMDRTLIASARFYQFCQSNGLKTGWIPVRLEGRPA